MSSRTSNTSLKARVAKANAKATKKQAGATKASARAAKRTAAAKKASTLASKLKAKVDARKTKRSTATITERKRKDGTIQRKRVNADGSIRNSRRTADGKVKSVTRKTSAGGTVKSMKRGGVSHNKSSAKVAKRNSATGVARYKKRVAKRKAARS